MKKGGQRNSTRLDSNLCDLIVKGLMPGVEVEHALAARWLVCAPTPIPPHRKFETPVVLRPTVGVISQRVANQRLPCPALTANPPSAGNSR